jgi:hypothetical protein
MSLAQDMMLSQEEAVRKAALKVVLPAVISTAQLIGD